MKYAKIGQLRDGLSRYIDEVREGTEVLVLDRGRPVDFCEVVSRQVAGG